MLLRSLNSLNIKKLFFAGCAIFSTVGFIGVTNTGCHKAVSNVVADTGALSAAALPASSAAPITTRFAPNYATDLLNLRRWQKSELVVFVAAPDASENSRDCDYEAAIRQGTDLWTPYLGGVLNVRFTNNSQEADIHVSFVDHNTLPDGAIGRTEVTYRNRDNVIVGATVRIDRTLKSSLLSQVAAHEFGHAFGMEGHSVDRGDLMYARAHLPAAITQRDSNTLHLNYSLQAARADAKPAVQVEGGSVVSTVTGTHTVAACSLPEESAH